MGISANQLPVSIFIPQTVAAILFPLRIDGFLGQKTVGVPSAVGAVLYMAIVEGYQALVLHNPSFLMICDPVTATRTGDNDEIHDQEKQKSGSQIKGHDHLNIPKRKGVFACFLILDLIVLLHM